MKNLKEAIADARAGRTSSICCPAHEDKSPSLSVMPPNSDGWVRIKCFSGCSLNDILTAGAVHRHDLGPENKVDFKTIRTPSGKLTLPSKHNTPSVSPSSKVEVEPWNEIDRVEKRKSWPPFKIPQEDELTAIAKLRGIPMDGLRLAVQRELLWVTSDRTRNLTCWTLSDSTRHNAQKRNFDGSKIPMASAPVKAFTLPGSATCWPVGLAALRPEHKSVLLVEGGPDLLAAFEFIRREKRQDDAHAVGILGAGARIHSSLCQQFTGKVIRIIQHADEAGHKAAQEWGDQLLPFAAYVEILDFGHLLRRDGYKVKDLNDALLVDEADYIREPHLQRLVP